MEKEFLLWEFPKKFNFLKKILKYKDKRTLILDLYILIGWYKLHIDQIWKWVHLYAYIKLNYPMIYLIPR